MPVRLDHPRHNRRARQIDRHGAGGRREIGADRDDPVSGDEHLPTWMDLAVDTVEHACGLSSSEAGSAAGTAATNPSISAAIIISQRMVIPLFPLYV